MQSATASAITDEAAETAASASPARRTTHDGVTLSFLHLMHAASGMFAPDALERLAPRARGGPRLAEVNGQGLGALDPIAATEAVAYDFLAKGGKHSRPFITLATYYALTSREDADAEIAERIAAIPDVVRRIALAIEIFHKASLVHDDIEDDDAYRYGDPTVHRAHGVPTAINVGDYLIGMGYRLVSRDAAELGPAVAADILDRFADAHLRLSEGQGAELTWRDARNKRLTPSDALRIYALKTAPAFEAAMYAGARLAGAGADYGQPIRQLAKHLGIAFQILNDLKDWRGDDDNKLGARLDVAGGRPTVLLALALEGLDEDRQQELLDLVGGTPNANQESTARRVHALYRSADVFDKALRLVDKHQRRAETVADELRPDELRWLCFHLIDMILHRPVEADRFS
jgi:geranylgeranyl pyrophosphate synthase